MSKIVFVLFENRDKYFDEEVCEGCGIGIVGPAVKQEGFEKRGDPVWHTKCAPGKFIGYDDRFKPGL